MKKILISGFLILNFCIVQGFALDSPNISLIQEHVNFLASDKQEGRGIGTEGIWKSARYIASHFSEYGLLPFGDGSTYFQNFFVTKGSIRLKVANVVALLPANDPTLSENYVVVGAHYDHLGYGSFGSLDPENPAIHNGADDNASGVAAVLEAARIFSQAFFPHGNLVFIAFASEELGLLGSAHFVKSPPYDVSQTFAMFNLDMVGRMKNNSLTVFGTGTAKEWDSLIDEINQSQNLDIHKRPSGLSPSDNTSFYVKDIPVLFFNTGSHGEYHQPTDDIALINFEGIGKVISFMDSAVLFVTGRTKKLQFQKTKDPHEDPGEGHGMPYFGSIPDYSFEGPGVKLNGVRTGSPAEEAGLKMGDVIIRIDNIEIKDIYDYTNLLKSRKPGDVIELVYQRGNEEITTKATLRKR